MTHLPLNTIVLIDVKGFFFFCIFRMIFRDNQDDRRAL
jgi:hypothetical protein